jgi:hypothetical protein
MMRRKRTGQYEFLVSWRGFTEDDDTWEPESNLSGCKALVDQFRATMKEVPTIPTATPAAPKKKGKAANSKK